MRYTANKFGFVDFWFYDFEEFNLSEGNLLLRGANGTGKSVTMQSFIPLLLDGNKSPYRLDPFGSSDKRLENYMLDENRDERTSYLYMEFKKENYYLSVGMGLKAVRNKPMSSWYFIVTDGRRLNKELMLFKDEGERFALTKKELQNRIGQGGFFTESQKQYMAKVNEYLYGFEDVENYEELLNLLIQVRAPKLSNEFRPNKVYEVLKASLKLLSDDDLKPMSDSMENMDRLRSSMEETRKALDSAKSIKRYYDRYNQSVLCEKARGYLDQYNEVKSLEAQAVRQERLVTDNEKKLAEKNDLLEDKKNGLRIANKKLEAYRESEPYKLKKELSEKEDSLKDDRLLYQKKEETLSGKKDSLKIQYAKIRGSENRVEELESRLMEEVEDSLSYAEEAAFEEGLSLMSEIKEPDYQFDYLKAMFQKYNERIKKAAKALEEYEGAKVKLLDAEDEESLNKSSIEAEKAELSRWEELLTNVKEELKEAYIRWNEENKLIKLNQTQLQQIFQGVNSVDQVRELPRVTGLLNAFFNEAEALLAVEEKLAEEAIKAKDEEIKSNLLEIERIKNTKDIEPERAEGVIANRNRLKAMKIPFMPFYKTVDFHKELPEKERERLESALWDMGLLDALVVEKKYKKEALAFEDGQHDKYIFTTPDFLQHSLKDFFVIEDITTLSSETVYDVLHGVFVSGDAESYLDEEGNFGLGVLRGRGNRDYELKYVGEGSRKRHRQNLLEELTAKAQSLLEQRLALENKKAAIADRMSEMKREEAAAPQTGQVEEALVNIESILRRLEDLDKKGIEISKRLFELKKLHDVLRKAATIACDGIELANNSSAYREAEENLRLYQGKLSDIRISFERVKNEGALLISAKDTAEDMEKDIEELRYELSLLEKKMTILRGSISALKEALSKSGLTEMEDEIEECRKVEETYPQFIEGLLTETGFLKSEVIRGKEKAGELRDEKAEEERKLYYVEKILEEERAREFIFPIEEAKEVKQDGGKTLYKICRDTIESLSPALGKSTAEYYTDLVQSYNKYSGELKEYNLKFTAAERPDNQDNRAVGFHVRTVIQCVLEGRNVSFYRLPETLGEIIKENEILIAAREREIFEEVLLNTISSKIKSKIYLSKIWVDEINEIMQKTDQGGRLKLSLRWLPKKAEDEMQMDIEKLLTILEQGTLSTEEEIKKLSDHFGAKMKAKIQANEETGTVNNYQSIIREVLDYRQWYEFKLFFIKDGERKKELTTAEFNRFSGGEKAMSMYIPLFSAVNARYNNARSDCPRIVCMDEAFAGVDDNNIDSMFNILNEMELDYVLTSQMLWGDYANVSNLAICNLIREPSDKFVVIERYHWNGRQRVYVEP